jgi:hypothetical protein
MIAHIYPAVLQAVSGRGYAGCLERVFSGVPEVRLCTILDRNFGEFLFHALRCIRHKDEGGGVPYVARLNAKLRSALGVFPRTTERERR